MGIVNVTPDSFSDGGQFFDPATAIAHGHRLIAAGADLLDIGGESTRPGATPVPLADELARVLPVVAGLRDTVPLSIDTMKAEVARQALAAGAHIINDVTALTGSAEMAEVVRAAGAGVVLMHMQGTPATMQQQPHYDDVRAEVLGYLQTRLQFAEAAGIARECVVLDPGIGFGKTLAHNVCLLRHLADLQQLGRPVCLGVSRKRLVPQILKYEPSDRLYGSLAALFYGVAQGAVQIARVHDVAATRMALDIFTAIAHEEL
jgi:dihydropteroate synthase